MIREVAAEPGWNFENVCFETNDTLSTEAYFDILSSCSASFELWETVYYHAMPSHEHLIEWVRSTRLRPYLDVLNEEQKSEFEQELLSKVRHAYPFTASGEVVLKFRRFFFTARKYPCRDQAARLSASRLDMRIYDGGDSSDDYQ